MKRGFDIGDIVIMLAFAAGVVFVFWNFNTTKGGGGVAVIRLEQIGQRLGKTESINQTVSQAKAEWDEELNQNLATIAEELQQKAQEFGESPTEEQGTTLSNLRNGMEQKKQANRQRVHQFRMELMNGFRAEVELIASEIAKARGATAILLYNPQNLLSIEPSVDITGAVLEKLQQGSQDMAQAQE